MEKTNLKKIMDQIGKDVVDEIKSDIVKKKAVRTGNMRDSISYKLIEDTNKINIWIDAIFYYPYVDEGTKYIKPRNFTKDVVEKVMDKYEDKVRKSVMVDIQEILNKKLYKK